MKVIVKQITEHKKTFSNGLLAVVLIGCTMLNIPALAINSSSVQSSLHTWTTEIVNADFVLLTATQHSQEIDHRKPRKRKRRRRQRIFRRKTRNQ